MSQESTADAQQNGPSYEDIAQTIGKLYLSLEQTEKTVEARYRDILGALKEQAQGLMVENANLKAQLNPEEKSDEEKE